MNLTNPSSPGISTTFLKSSDIEFNQALSLLSKTLVNQQYFFVLFEQPGDNIVKKTAGYHQFHAVRAALEATIIADVTSVLDDIAQQIPVPVDDPDSN